MKKSDEILEWIKKNYYADEFDVNVLIDDIKEYGNYRVQESINEIKRGLRGKRWPGPG